MWWVRVYVCMRMLPHCMFQCGLDSYGCARNMCSNTYTKRQQYHSVLVWHVAFRTHMLQLLPPYRLYTLLLVYCRYMLHFGLILTWSLFWFENFTSMRKWTERGKKTRMYSHRERVWLAYECVYVASVCCRECHSIVCSRQRRPNLQPQLLRIHIYTQSHCNVTFTFVGWVVAFGIGVHVSYAWILSIEWGFIFVGKMKYKKSLFPAQRNKPNNMICLLRYCWNLFDSNGTCHGW